MNENKILSPSILVKPVHQNGFSWPPSLFQLLLYFLDIFFGLDFYLFNSIAISSNLVFMVIIVIIYSLFLVLTLFFIIKGSSIDPSDPAIRITKECKEKDIPFPDEEKYNFQCKVCKSHVEDRSKHCGECNRCVNEFDHHCIWLNNCVGKANYKYFLGLMIFGFLQCIVIVGINIFLIYSYSSSDGIDNLIKYLGENVKIAAWVFNCIVLVGAIVCVVYFGYLIIFHIWLIREGITTYEYILRLRAELQKRNNPDMEEIPPKLNSILKKSQTKKRKSKLKSKIKDDKHKPISKKFHGDSTDENKIDNHIHHFEKGISDTPVLNNELINIKNDNQHKPNLGQKIVQKLALCTNPISKVEEPELNPSFIEKNKIRECNYDEIDPEKLDVLTQKNLLLIKLEKNDENKDQEAKNNFVNDLNQVPSNENQLNNEIINNSEEINNNKEYYERVKVEPKLSKNGKTRKNSLNFSNIKEYIDSKGNNTEALSAQQSDRNFK